MRRGRSFSSQVGRINATSVPDKSMAGAERSSSTGSTGSPAAAPMEQFQNREPLIYHRGRFSSHLSLSPLPQFGHLHLQRWNSFPLIYHSASSYFSTPSLLRSLWSVLFSPPPPTLPPPALTDVSVALDKRSIMSRAMMMKQWARNLGVDGVGRPIDGDTGAAGNGETGRINRAKEKEINR